MDAIAYLEEMWDLALQGKTQGVFFWAATYAFVGLAYSLVFQFRAASWPSTTGELLESRARIFGGAHRVESERDYVASTRYRYVVDGTEYEGRRLSPWVFVASHNAKSVLERQLRGVQQHPDGSVTVFYNPKKPEKSYLIKPGITGRIVTGVLAVVPLVLYWSRYGG
jgi:hypothetical protein